MSTFSSSSTSSSTASVQHDLWGGAVTVDVPAGFDDISRIRQVPDNQEVFACQDSDRSLIVEILERQDVESVPGIDDSQVVARWFFNNLAAENGSLRADVEHVEGPLDQNAVPFLAQSSGSSAGIVIGLQAVSKFRESATNTVRVFLCVLRLPQYKSDVLVTLNRPIVLDPASSSAQAVAAATQTQWHQGDEEIFRRFLRTFNIVDGRLFGE